jgi:uncharacterized protein (DUF1501 family)
MKRRNFLKQSALVSGSVFIPGFLDAFRLQEAGEEGGRVLIFVQLSGGNDGLNTLIPYRNDLYYRARPGLGLKGAEIHPFEGDLAMHPALAPLLDIYNDGSMAVLNQVGYPNPDRSHFRSMDIWHTASDSNVFLRSGWLGRYLDNYCDGQGCSSHSVLEIDDALSLAVKGENLKGLALTNAAQLYARTNTAYMEELAAQKQSDSSNLSYLYKTLSETVSSAEYLNEYHGKYQAKADFPKGTFGRNLKTCAELINSGLDSRVYYVSLGGFDTHINQLNIQNRLLSQYAQGMAALYRELKKTDRWKNTLIVTFSEFGRRVEQNASRGTDHGAANYLMLMGGALKKAGLLNGEPDLSQLDRGDLIHQVDFRSVYATVLNKWLQVDDELVLGRAFDKLDFLG